MAEEDDLIGSFFSEIQEIEACAGEPGMPPPSDAQFASVISRPVVFAKSAEVVAAAAPSIRVVPVEYPDSIESARLNRYSHSSEHAAPVGAAPPIKRQDKKFVRAGANEVWVDETLCEWPENDFRLFVGDLGNEVTTEMLAKEFQGKYSSFAKAKVANFQLHIFFLFISPFPSGCAHWLESEIERLRICELHGRF